MLPCSPTPHKKPVGLGPFACVMPEMRSQPGVAPSNEGNAHSQERCLNAHSQAGRTQITRQGVSVKGIL